MSFMVTVKPTPVCGCVVVDLVDVVVDLVDVFVVDNNSLLDLRFCSFGRSIHLSSTYGRVYQGVGGYVY